MQKKFKLILIPLYTLLLYILLFIIKNITLLPLTAYKTLHIKGFHGGTFRGKAVKSAISGYFFA